jgi:L-histidine Nalpha-methyltransferase
MVNSARRAVSDPAEVGRASIHERFEVVRPSGRRPDSTLANDVRRGLVARPRTLPPKHFYDDVGCRLFDEICELPEYYLTRAERALLARHGDEIVDAAGAPILAELGSGMARKTGILLGAMARRHRSPLYVPFDIAPSAIDASARDLSTAHPTVRVRGVIGDFGHDLERLATALDEEPAPRRLFAFLGSTIGNLDEDEAPALIRRVAAVMRPADTFLLGIDRVKDTGVLLRAYDDVGGVTARFNLNVLAMMNRELDADFDLRSFRHLARWNTEKERIEMHLLCTRGHTVHLRALGLEVSFECGETIHTEISRKFTEASLRRTLERGGMQLERCFGDGAFTLALARRDGDAFPGDSGTRPIAARRCS